MAPRNRNTIEEPTPEDPEISTVVDIVEETPDEPVVEDTNGNNAYVPSRSAVATEIPGRTRKSSDYSAWANEIEALRTDSLGQAFSYDNVPNVSGLAQGLKRTYGVHAEVRDIITAANVKDDPTLESRKGHGTLWITFEPFIKDGQLDEEMVAEQKAKYTK